MRVFASLCWHNFSEYLALKHAYENIRYDDLPLLAWHARSLLELSVWAMYSAKSTEHALRVYEDAGRDVRGIFDAFLKWGTATAQLPDWLDPISIAKVFPSASRAIGKQRRRITRREMGRLDFSSPSKRNRAGLFF